MPGHTPPERDLSSGYAASHRAYEWVGITFAILCAGWLFFRVYRGPVPMYALPIAIVGGILFADFTSGFMHWVFDTWGSTRTPVVGQLAIRTFREHHVDQKAITRHDFIETNGHNFALSVLPSCVGLWITDDDAGSKTLGTFFLAGAIFVALTSQIHKWAHMDKPPLFVRVLQRARILLSSPHHAVHHKAPYTRSYCITTGWLDGPLHAFRFFETLEALITATTGAIPRREPPSPEVLPDDMEEAPQTE